MLVFARSAGRVMPSLVQPDCVAGRLRDCFVQADINQENSVFSVNYFMCSQYRPGRLG